MNAIIYDYAREKETAMNERANDYQRVAERYAAELVDKLRVPHTYEEAVTMIAVAYLEGGMAQMKWARDTLRGDEARTADRLAQLRAVKS